MGLGRPRRKTSDKRKVLGAFLEAPRRKSWFLGPKTENLRFSLKFRRKSIFGAKSAEIAKWRKTSQNLTISALKTYSKRHILLFWGPKAPKTPKWGEFHGISWNSVTFSKPLVFSRNFSILGKRGAQSRNGSQIPMKTTRNTWCFGIAPRARPVFMKMLKMLKPNENHDFHESIVIRMSSEPSRWTCFRSRFEKWNSYSENGRGL